MGKKNIIVESSSSKFHSDLYNEELGQVMSLSLKIDILNVKDALKVVNERIKKYLDDYK